MADARRIRARKAKKLIKRDNTVVMPGLRKIFRDKAREAGRRRLN